MQILNALDIAEEAAPDGRKLHNAREGAERQVGRQMKVQVVKHLNVRKIHDN